MNFQISVVIPVYNAANYVRSAVESCLQQPEVAEVLLIEDASPDNSLEICRQLSEQFQKVRLLQHPGGINKGAGPTRNLGMLAATNEYISFLDADDYYLPDRFKVTREIFTENPKADGVYEAVGIFGEGVDGFKLYTINRKVAPEKLFHYLLRGTYGHFSTNALTFKKSLLKKTGLFDTTLRLHQDSELWLRMAFHGRLYAGCIHKPVTFVRRHKDNRIIHANFKSRLEFWQVVIDYFVQQPVSKIDYALIFWKYCRTQALVNNVPTFEQLWRVLKDDGKKATKLISIK